MSRATTFSLLACTAHAAQHAPAVKPPAEDSPQTAATETTATAPDKNSPVTTTVVTATRVEENAYDIPVSVTVVDAQRLAETQPRTTAEALRRTPGVWVQQTGHLGGAPIVRGFMGNQVVYLFDGVRRNTAGLFAGPNSFLNTVDALDIDRIEVVRGPGSVLYGSDAIGGVVNVITNERPRFGSETQLGGTLFSRYSSVDRESSHRAESYLSTPDLFVSLGGTYRDISDVSGGREVGVQTPSRWRERNYDGQIDYRLDEDASLELFFQDYSRPLGTRYDRPNWRQEDDRELFGVRLRSRDVGPLDELEATLYHHDQRSYVDERFFDSQSEDRTVGLDLQATNYVSDELRLVYGLHAHQDRVESGDPQNGAADPDVEWINPAAFVLTEWQATEKLRLDFGVRVDHFGLDSDAPALGALPQPIQDAIANGAFALSDLELDQNDTALTGGLGAVLQVTEHDQLFAHVGRSFRAPNKSDLLSYGQFTFGFNVPSPEVEPESSLSYELGARRETEDFAGAISAFYTEVDDAIVSAPGTFNGQSYVDVNGNGVQDPAEAVFVNTNSTGVVRAMGVDVEARQWLSREWTNWLAGDHDVSCYGNFSWIYGEDTGRDEPLDRAYPANALLGVRVDDARETARSAWWMELEVWLVRAFDRIPSTRRFSDPAFKNDPQDPNSGLLGGSGDVPGFGLVNLRGGVHISSNTSLFFAAENLGDRAYRIKDSRIDGTGMSFTVGLQASF
jgi:hemoglobin/transferrin/lactoferrin receptor protein